MRFIQIPLFAVFWIPLLWFNPTFSQSYVADTLILDIENSLFENSKSKVIAIDLRDDNPRFISVFEKKKYLVFPVDQIVITKKPLTNYFENHATIATEAHYKLSIHEFYLDYSESYFNRNLKLNAYIELSRIEQPADTAFMGIFYYEQSKKFTKKDTLLHCYKNMWQNFSSNFYYDFTVVTSDSLSKIKSSDYHFRKGQRAAPKNFYVSTDVYYGNTFWGLDAEIWFATPEMAQKFKQNTRMFRYLNYGNRQSVAFSPNVSLFNYRINNNWLFQNKHGFIFGFNKWNDVDEAKRTIEELFLFQYAFSQRITHNSINKNGLVFGLGLFEEASYIIYNDPIFNVGVLLHCAYKF